MLNTNFLLDSSAHITDSTQVTEAIASSVRDVLSNFTDFPLIKTFDPQGKPTGELSEEIATILNQTVNTDGKPIIPIEVKVSGFGDRVGPTEQIEISRVLVLMNKAGEVRSINPTIAEAIYQTNANDAVYSILGTTPLPKVADQTPRYSQVGVVVHLVNSSTRAGLVKIHVTNLEES